MARENCQCWIQVRISGVVLSGLSGKGGPMGFDCGGLGMRDQGSVAIVCWLRVVVKSWFWEIEGVSLALIIVEKFGCEE